jgi:tetratricopeptide (TPR) repeat protein
LLVGLALLAAGAGAWSLWRRPRGPAPAAVEPPMPAHVEEAEVREALQRAREGVLSLPGSDVAWGEYGLTLLAHDFAPEAGVCFAEAARLGPDNALWELARGYMAERLAPETALPHLRRAVEIGLPTAEAQTALRLHLAEWLLERRDLDGAEAIFRDELGRDPRNMRATFGLGRVALGRDDDREATSLFEAARGWPPARKAVAAHLATLARARGDEAAAARLEAEVAALPDDLPWPGPLDDELVRRQVGSRKLLDEAAALQYAGQLEEAAAVYRRLAATRPTVQAWVGAGLNLARLGRYDEALALLRRAVDLGPQSPQARAALAQTLFARAEAEWARAPGSGRAREWFAEVVEPARRVVELRPSHAHAYLLWGLALRLSGNPASAVAPLRKGALLQPGSFEMHLALGEALLDLGREQEACEHLEKARRLAPDDKRLAEALARLRRPG